MMVRAFQDVLCVNKPNYMVCYTALCDVGQFAFQFAATIDTCLHAVCSPQMADRTNRHNSTNGEEWGGAWGSIENLGEYG